MTDGKGLSRRSFVKGAALTGAALALPAGMARASRPAANGKTVAIFGAGMAGLAAAHELADRGFDVHVYERLTQLGGKARSWNLAGTGTGGRAGLPAEHGFRFFPGFYENVPDTMMRIPRPAKGDTVYASLRGLDAYDGFGAGISLGPGQSIATFIPYKGHIDPDQLPDASYLVATLSAALALLIRVPAAQLPAEFADFVQKLAVFITSSWDRRYGEWEKTGWWKFLGADAKSKLFQDLIVRGTTQDLVAVKPQKCSVLAAGDIIEAFVWNLMGVHSNARTATALRLLDGPTSDVWLNPWIAHLRGLGVKFHKGQALGALNVRNGRIDSARVVDKKGKHRTVEADWYMSAAPVDKVAGILTRKKLLQADPSLEGIRSLEIDHMNGMQIYLRKPPEQTRGGLFVLDHPWTISAVTQSQLWSESIKDKFGDGTVGECLSIDISTWDAATQGSSTTTVVGKAAQDCTKDEVFQEIWTTLKDRFGQEDSSFSDANLHSWTLDPAVEWSNGTTGTVTFDESLSVGTVDTWDKRPKGPTAIPNLFISGDWIQQLGSGTANMESGNTAGRIAAQAVIDASGRKVPDVTIYNLDHIWQPSQLDGVKQVDADRYKNGQPNILDTGGA